MRILIIYISLFLLTSCSKKYKQLSANTMKIVMWELLNAEELMKINATNDTAFSIKENRPIYYQKIFSLNQISQFDFDKNYQFFQNHPTEMKILLDSISNFGIKQREKVIKSL